VAPPRKQAATEKTNLILQSWESPAYSQSQPYLYYDPAFLHGVHAFDYIRITFNADVVIDFYNLQLQTVGAEGNVMPITGFTYDPASRTATWTVAGQTALQNARYLATLTGVRDSNGGLLPGGIYTNSFSILTCDVTGDGQVSPPDLLTLINHINGGLPYQPALDVNWAHSPHIARPISARHKNLSDR
jgi:hypothetical protein